MSKQLVVRVQSPQGTKRVSASPSETLKTLLSKVQQEFELGPTGWNCYTGRDKKKELKALSTTLQAAGIKHGDMLFLFGPEAKRESTTSSASTSSAMTNGTMVKPPTEGGERTRQPEETPPERRTDVVIDEVDQILSKQNGQIIRQRDPQLCRHGTHQKCLHCVPLEPYDETYLKSCDPPIKFTSFHAHLRKLTGGVTKDKYVFLENLSCIVKPNCGEHAPYPKGLCSKCQPSPVTLNRQTYRHVDNIMFENAGIVDRFLNYWRRTGHQRAGFMYGVYEQHPAVPLGIRARVTAIYEPPQVSSTNSLELQEDPYEEVISEITNKLGLSRIGWIFTDLVADDLEKGTVKHFRGNVETHFLSGQECMMAGKLQSEHPNPCQLSADGNFGSKFVTVVMSGDKENQIHPEGYQVSNQCMALVRDNCMVPCRDAPELGYIKESSNEQYVPDVFYKLKDEYNNEVTKLGRPLPLEYLLVDIPAGVAKETEASVFTDHPPGVRTPFPPENRQIMGEMQDFGALSTYMAQFERRTFLEAVSDLHFLFYLATMEIYPMRPFLEPLLDAIKEKNRDKAADWAHEEAWATVEQLIAAQGPSPDILPSGLGGALGGPLGALAGGGASAGGAVGGGAGAGPSAAMWACPHCTFLNQPDLTTCEICSLPKS